MLTETHEQIEDRLLRMRAALVLTVLACGVLPGASVHTDFEGGSLERVQKIDNSHFRLHANGEKDANGRNRQASWYYFRVDGAGNREITFDMVGLPGEYNFRPNQGAITG